MRFVDPADLVRADEIALAALDANGILSVLPASFWARYTRVEIGTFCVRHGIYCIPTTELVAWLRECIGEWLAIEIGSGCGVLADALGIEATDNRMQEWPEIKQVYTLTGQTPIVYGSNVKPYNAIEALQVYKPSVVVAAWVTHRYSEKAPERGGNAWGVDFDQVLAVSDLIFIGNRYVHRHAPMLDWPHEEFTFPWLVSRAWNGDPDFIGIWRRGAHEVAGSV
jgi:hypothetical protein